MQFFEDDLELQARKRRAETEVNAEAEGRMRLGVFAADVEPLRLGEVRVVVVA